MFKKTDAQQTLFGARSKLSNSAQQRLERSWAEGFRREVLPLLMESEPDFAPLYGVTGRPNYSVGRVLGICLLQELNNLSDQAALDSFSFDVRWQHAVDVDDDEAYLSRRSLVEFRRRLVENDPEMDLMRGVFDRIAKGAVRRLGINTAEQRLDSTLVMSNIRDGGLLELFRSATFKFLSELGTEQLTRVPDKTKTWCQESRDGWFGIGPSERRDKLSELLPQVKRLLDLFVEDRDVVATESYKLLRQVFDEHCEVVIRKVRWSISKKKRGRKARDKTPSHRKIEKVVLKTRRGARLQSVHDPDAEYGHKGTGYKAQITESCNNDGKSEIITDYEVHGNARSDVGKAREVVDRLEQVGMQPDMLFADAGYPTPEDLVGLKGRGTNLMAPVHRGSMKKDMMNRTRFRFDDKGRVHRCPCGHKPIDHRVRNPNGDGVHLHAYFEGDKCRACDKLGICPVRAPNHRGRGCGPRETTGNFRLDISAKLRHRDQRLSEQRTKRWLDRYRIRAGIEGTMSELKRAHGMSRLRVRRLPQVRFAISCKITACNVKRWLRAALGGFVDSFSRFLERISEDQKLRCALVQFDVW